MMESRNKGNGLDGEEVRMGANKRCDLALRLLGLILTLAAAIIFGVDKQTKVVPITVFSNLPPLNVPVTAKWHYMSSFVYFVVTNASACLYAAVSLLLALANRGGKGGMALMITFLDLVMVALLFSANGAAIAVGVLGYKGNSHVHWNKVCNVFGKFCHQSVTALVLSMLGSLAFLWLVALAALNLHKKHK